MRIAPIKIGDVFGRLTVMEYLGRNKWRNHQWLCQCMCGNTHKVTAPSLVSGHTKSCGCYRKEVAYKGRYKHGGKKKYQKEYWVWKTMRSRCNNPNTKAYKNYGGRGIKVCDRWNDFQSFIDDMGLRPSDKHTIERIDNDGDYCPENCKWVTRQEQNNNTRRTLFVQYGGRTITILQLAKELGHNPHTLARRKRCGWTDEEVVNTPIGGNRYGL